MSPLQAGAVGTVPATGTIALPQASFIAGGVGATASEGQLTMDDPFAGNVKSGTLIV
jgi:hypothetical protein